MPRDLDFSNITKQRLIKAFDTAQQYYLYGNPLDPRPKVIVPSQLGPDIQTQHEFTVGMKNFYSLGLSLFHRYRKANARIPDLVLMTDTDALHALENFLLQAEGKKGLFSLKYNLVCLLAKRLVQTDADAIALVDDFTNRLGAHLRPSLRP